MSTIIYTGYSDNNAELALLTMPNKQQYADRHGYTLVADKTPWEEFKVGGLLRIRELLDRADNVLSVGSDVLFMNHRLTVESLILDERAVCSAETISYWPLNNDVFLWQNNETCRKLLDRIIQDASIWLRTSWLWQAYLWDLIQTEPEIAASVRIAPPREVQSVHQQGIGKWQFGDRIIHFLDYPDRAKIVLAMMYLPFAGEPTTATLLKMVGGVEAKFVRDSFESEENFLAPDGKAVWRLYRAGELVVQEEKQAA